MSNARHTPETDAVANPFRQRNDLTYAAMLNHARKLESQRDELLAALEAVCKADDHRMLASKAAYVVPAFSAIAALYSSINDARAAIAKAKEGR